MAPPDHQHPTARRQPADGHRAAAGTSRRSLLLGLVGVAGAGTLAAVAGCDIFGTDTPAVEPIPSDLQGFLAATTTLGDRYDATLAAVDSLPATIGQIRDAHRAHARALAQAIGAPTPAASASPGRIPIDRDQALAALITAEKAAHEEAVRICLASQPRFAALLGSIAAARATNLVGLS